MAFTPWTICWKTRTIKDCIISVFDMWKSCRHRHYLSNEMNVECGEFYIPSVGRWKVGIELSWFHLDLITHSVYFSGIIIELFKPNSINYYHCWDQLIEIQDHTLCAGCWAERWDYIKSKTWWLGPCVRWKHWLSIIPFLIDHLGIVQVFQFGCGLHVCPHQAGDQRHGLCRAPAPRLTRAPPGLGWKSTSPTLERIRPDHLLDHPDRETLLEPAELAAVPPPLVHGAVLVRQADVLGALLNRSLEEALAALAGSHPVVLTRGVVPAHGAQQARARPAGLQKCCQF